MREHITDAIRFWELARVPYNLVLAAMSLGILVYGGLDELGWIVMALPLFILAVIANALYCVAYPIDLLVRASDFRGPWLHARTWAQYRPRSPEQDLDASRRADAHGCREDKDVTACDFTPASGRSYPHASSAVHASDRRVRARVTGHRGCYHEGQIDRPCVLTHSSHLSRSRPTYFRERSSHESRL